MKDIDELTINTIRILSVEAIEKAKSGHPGLPLGSAPIAYTLWAKGLKHNPKNPNWSNRDRFILSAGHGSALLYSILYLFGYELTIDDLKQFRQWGSKTPGHPEYGHTIGIETTTGPLGQGIANGVGMAIAEAYLAKKFNKPGYPVVDHNTYCLAGDGCMMEGISSEAASLAGTLGLGKLIVFYDSNNITIEGNTNIAFTENVGKRFESYGWQVLNINDGNDIKILETSLDVAKKEFNKPTIIIVKTQIGYGCPEKQGKASAHGEPLGEENIKCTKRFLNWEHKESFFVPEEVKDHMNKLIKNLEIEENKWNKLKTKYNLEFPELAKEWEIYHSKDLPINLLGNKNFWSFQHEMSTRNASGKVINRLADKLTNLIGGSADLAPSNKTRMKNEGDFTKENRAGRNLHFGIREHAMSAIANGIYLHGGLIPYVSTFLVFSDYMKASMRLSALMKLPIIYVLTHDSIGVGEDGPTHEPIEQLASLRSIPNMTVYRPADAKETAAAWYYSLTNKNSPTSIVLTRQDVPLYDETGKDALRGAYILKDSKKEVPDLILMASGSEVELIYEAEKKLEKRGIDARVVSFPSFEVFENQDNKYKESILPKSVKKRLAVEAATSFGWYKYIGLEGNIISIDHFGASAPAKELFNNYGFTVENVVSKALKLIQS
ncbi:transketolase [Clostridium tyrobutyricum]|uniref:transketolase n=1 Tax=Clostridium tyrobutyricum TaxID=1519 RepID=UPI000300806C|nr:transketolase [Clostridium tyrobutyricum]MBR9647925.1 transketolase [Clostridium tyrobutyricum]MBV4415086.1 transketolase [Clostridium tyrobutyricum]MBV4421088.1 transketolase [Clostridium tyrobutyricum]MBV4428754.1 transketolase [Clostridium tyrobutyricum]MBV4430744.1 transketolase [Clostridium tyrobutyricum]